MTYCTASARPTPASRTFAAIATTLAALAKITVLCVPLTVAVSLAIGSEAFAQQPEAAQPAGQTRQAGAGNATDPTAR
ncbi:MAG: hypothetical protein ABSE67_19075 [Xanthobacteraceae bacterium]